MSEKKRAEARATHLADHALAVRAAGGDRVAMTEVAERLLDTVRTTVRFISGDAKDQEDMCQMAIIEILLSIGSFRGESLLETWANKIVVRKTISLVKKNHNWIRFRQNAKNFAVSSPEQPLPQGNRFLIRERLAKAFEKLPIKYRSPVTLRLVYDQDIDDIAHTLRVPKNTARQQLRRGKKMLREMIKKDRILCEILEGGE